MASINMKSLVVGEQPPGYEVGDAYHYILMRILMAARTHDLQAIDGPYMQIRDLDGLRRVAARSGGAGLRRQMGAAPRFNPTSSTNCSRRPRRTTTMPS